MTKLIATRSQMYRGRALLPSTPFSVETEAEAADLIALRYASRDTSSPSLAPERLKRSYRRRDLRAEPLLTAASIEEEGPRTDDESDKA